MAPAVLNFTTRFCRDLLLLFSRLLTSPRSLSLQEPRKLVLVASLRAEKQEQEQEQVRKAR